MNTISTFIPQKWVQALGWTLLHSLWQGVIAALVLGLLLLLLHRQSATIRYFVAALTFFTFLLVSVVTFIKEYNLLAVPERISVTNVNYASGFPMELAAVSGDVQIQPGSLTQFYSTFSAYFTQHLPLLVMLWSLGIMLLLLRFLGGLAYSQRLKHYKTTDLPQYWQHCVDNLSKRAQIRQTIRLVESGLVKVPMVIGYFKPVILLPVGTVLGLPVEQVEAIIAHELAHISRKDYLLNIAQCLVEVLFFYHPAIWWMSARIREEREHCCDDMALSLCGDSITFAKALANLEGVQAGPAMLALGFIGRGNSLLYRIQRLIDGPRRSPNFMEGFIAACFLLASIMAVSVSAGTVLTNQTETQQTEQTETKEVDSGQSTHLELADSLKKKDKGTFTYKGTKNGRKYDIKATIENDKVTKLSIDGKKVPISEIEKYEGLLDELMEEVPTPPVPPAPATAAVSVSPHVAAEDLETIPPVEPHQPLPPIPSMEPMVPLPPSGMGQILKDIFNGDTAGSKNHKGTFTSVHESKDGREYMIVIKDGEIKVFEVDGKDIPEDQYKNYAFLADEISEQEHEHHAEAIAHREEAEVRNKESRREWERNMQQLGENRLKMSEELVKNREYLLKKLDSVSISAPIRQLESMQGHDRQMQQLTEMRREHEKQIQRHAEMMQEHNLNMRKHEQGLMLKEELKKDDLIKDDRNYRFRMDSSGLYVDGEKQPEAVFEKYKKLIEKENGKLPADFNINFEYKNEDE